MKEGKASYPSVVVKKIIHAKREDVFDAWTKAELMQQWLVPKNWTAKTDIDLRVGGNYSQDMLSDGSESCCTSEANPTPSVPRHKLHTGEYLEITRPEKLVFTWNTSNVHNTRVTVDLRELNDSTEVTVTHELLPTEDLRKGHTQGWEVCLENLSTLLC